MEDELIEGCKRKERKAQKELYSRYASLFLGICARYARDRNEAEDILQEAFVKIFFKIDDFEGKGSFEGWMKRVVVNTAINYYHQQYKLRHHKEIDEIPDSQALGNELQTADFTQAELMSIITALPLGYRMVFNLYAIEGYKHKEIAQMLKIDVNTSKSQYSRAKGLIRKKLEAIGHVPSPQ